MKDTDGDIDAADPASRKEGLRGCVGGGGGREQSLSRTLT